MGDKLAKEKFVTKEPQNCALCDEPIALDNDSKEHIIPNAIGGRLTVQGFLCRVCNSRTGEEWDDVLAKQLNPVCNLLDIKRQRGRPPALEVNTMGGLRVRHRSDGHITTDRFRVFEHRIADKTHVQVTAPSLRELRRHLPGLIRTYPQLEGVDLSKYLTQTKEYLSDPLAIHMKFGGHQTGRSVVKSCVALAHIAGARLSDLEQAREYLKDQDAPCFGYYNEREVVLNRPPRTFFHCVHVRGDEESRKVLGYVELFGYQRMVVLLSDSYSGPPFSICYAVDPVAGREIELEVELPDFSSDEIQAIYDYKKVDYEKARTALESLIEWYMEESSKRERSRAIEDAVDYAIKKCGVELGEVVTEEQCNLVAKLVVERLTPFLLHQQAPSQFKLGDE